MSSPSLQSESPHVAAQSAAQLDGSSPAQQAPSPQLDPQSAAHEHGDSPPPQVPSPHEAASNEPPSKEPPSKDPASRLGIGPTSRSSCTPPRSSVHATSERASESARCTSAG
jgi:hypothetical protein